MPILTFTLLETASGSLGRAPIIAAWKDSTTIIRVALLVALRLW